MRAVVQRVSQASVSIDNEQFASIRKGLLILIGIEDADSVEDCVWLAAKIANMRIFSDEAGLMNLSVNDIHGEALVISQFTLFASTKKGNRPSFIRAGKPEFASKLYEIFCNQLSAEMSRLVKTGIFAADMQIALVNDGPVTIIIDTKQKE
jgi:D-tyrosyl-tRNA(Tyr) deacylase